MADNDKFKIEQIDYFPNGDDKRTVIFIKARSEYEDMIAESIYNEKLLRMTKSGIFSNINPDSFEMTLLTKSARVESLYLAKAVVARLFGEGE